MPPQPSRSILPLLALALACLGLLSPLIIGHAKRVEVDASLEVFLAADERSRGSMEKLQSAMTERAACLVLVRFEGIFSNDGAQLIHELSEGLMTLKVPRLFSLTRARRPVRSKTFSLSLNDMVDFEHFLPLDERTDEEWSSIEELVTGYPWARDLLASKDGEWTMLIAEIERPLETHEQRAKLRSDVESVVAPFRDRVDELHYSSFPFIEAEMHDNIEDDVQRFLYMLPLLLAAILLVTFRSGQVLVCVLSFEAMGVGLVPAVFNWNGAALNLYTGILFPLVAGLQLTFLTHFFAALRWAQGKGQPFAHALPTALHHVVRPSAFACITTVIGLLSLLACDVGLVKDFGWLGAQSVLLCFVVTFTPPFLLARFLARRNTEPQLELHARDNTDAVTGTVARLVSSTLEHRGSVLTAALVLALLALPALALVRTDLRAIEFLSPESQSRQAMTAVDTHMGGMNLFELAIDCGRPGGVQEPEALHFLDDLENYCASVEGVTNVYGYAQIYSMLNEIWLREAPGSRSVPEKADAIAALGMVVHSTNILFEESMFDADRQRTTIFIRTRDMPAERYLGILQDIVGYADASRPEHVTIVSKSGLHSVLDSDRRIVRSQISSLSLCLGAVFLTLCLLWRSPRLALVAILANIPALAAVLALHGYAGIPLNSVTVMVGAVVLGIAVDNGIHLLSFYKDERERFDDPRTCLRWVLAHKLVPMACTTAVLVSGFSLFLFSSFPPLADFGVLSILALVVALTSTALVLPPLLVLALRERMP
jgi:uncharacterized protein